MTMRSARFLWWMVALLLLVTWLGLGDIDTNPIWDDERYSLRDAGGAFYGGRSWVDIWQQVGANNPWHVPGYFFLLNGWGRLVGWEISSLRLLSLLLGLLTLAWTYRLGASRVSRVAGLYGAALLGTSMLFLHYLVEIRMYTQTTALAVFAVWVYLRVSESPQPGRLAWAGLLAGLVGLLYTHYFAALTVVMLGLLHAGRLLRPARVNWRRWWRVSGVFALAGLLFLPWFSGLLAGLTRNADTEQDFLYRRAMSTPEALERIAFFFSNGQSWLLLVLLPFMLAGLVLLRGRRRWGLAQIAVAAALTLALVLLANEILLVMSPRRIRYVVGALPLVLLGIGGGLAVFERRTSAWSPLVAHAPVIGLLAVWLVTSVMADSQRIPSREINGFDYLFPIHTVAQRLEPDLQPGDIIVTFIADDDPMQNHHYRGIAPFYFGSEYHYALRRSAMLGADPAAQVDFSSASQRLRAWVAYPTTPHPTGLDAFLTALDDEFDMCRTDTRDGITIEYHARTPVCCLTALTAEPLITYPDEVALVGFDTLPRADDTTLPVVTTWAVGEDSAFYHYSMALHVLNAGGELVAQSDEGLPVPAFVCHQTDIDISSLPSGDYTVHLIVYNWETGARLPGTTTDETTSDRLPMSEFTVE